MDAVAGNAAAFLPGQAPATLPSSSSSFASRAPLSAPAACAASALQLWVEANPDGLGRTHVDPARLGYTRLGVGGGRENLTTTGSQSFVLYRAEPAPTWAGY